jgi:hypothetical protein
VNPPITNLKSPIPMRSFALVSCLFPLCAALAATAGAYEPGQPVTAWGSATVRASASPTAAVRGTQAAGAAGTMVTGQPVFTETAEEQLGWLEINFASGVDGWVSTANIVVELEPISPPRLSMTWRDRSTNEEEFVVERADGTGAFARLGAVGANTEQFVDLTITPGTVHAYRVIARTVAGVTGPSNILRARRAVPPPPPNGRPGELQGESEPISGDVVNLSVRVFVGAGDARAIPGLVVSRAPVRMLIRAVGPTLGAEPYNVEGVLADPQITLQGVAGAANDNWSGADVAAAAAQVGAFALPAGSKDAALIVTLPPGQYTALVSGVGGTTGVALIETYELR